MWDSLEDCHRWVDGPEYHWSSKEVPEVPGDTWMAKVVPQHGSPKIGDLFFFGISILGHLGEKLGWSSGASLTGA